MNTINNASLRNILKTCWFTPSYGSTDSRTVWGLPLMLAGDPGTGKTSMVTAEARALGMQVKVNIASISDPTDYGGIPVAPADGSRFAHMLLPQWAREVFGWQGAGVLVFDEFTTVSPAVQAALLRVVLERYVGDAQLPDRVRVVGAMNPPEQAAGGAGFHAGAVADHPPALAAFEVGQRQCSLSFGAGRVARGQHASAHPIGHRGHES